MRDFRIRVVFRNWFSVGRLLRWWEDFPDRIFGFLQWCSQQCMMCGTISEMLRQRIHAKFRVEVLFWLVFFWWCERRRCFASVTISISPS